MNTEEIRALVRAQREFFRTGHTLEVSNRLEALQSLKDAVEAHKDDIFAALKRDLGKCADETFMCEYGLVLSELSYVCRHVRGWSRPRMKRTPVSGMPAVSRVQASPRGTVLIMSPWNYPLLLTLEPLVDAIAAGNTAVLKPSAQSPATTEVISRIIDDAFEPEYVSVITGGHTENEGLLDMHFDHIFFTGSQRAGREIMKKAAEHLTPVTLELGGKSPVIVDETADIDAAARRLVWGKFLNCGQTCVAPDYVLCHESVIADLEDAVRDEIMLQYGERPLKDDTYGRIVNLRHFDRLMGLIKDQPLTCGGNGDVATLRIEPTVICPCEKDTPVMREEIFGPILPIIPYTDLEEELKALEHKPQPLAFYVFSRDRSRVKEILRRMRFGGACVNDTIMHLATSYMGFGGSGESGIGAYHGKVGFDTFSHHKSIYERKTRIDPPLRYRPFKVMSRKIMRLIMH